MGHDFSKPRESKIKTVNFPSRKNFVDDKIPIDPAAERRAMRPILSQQPLPPPRSSSFARPKPNELRQQNFQSRDLSPDFVQESQHDSKAKYRQKDKSLRSCLSWDKNPNKQESDQRPRQAIKEDVSESRYPKGTCDKCDGAHLTDNCPIYKKKRDDHPDAWRNFGRKSPLEMGKAG